MSTPKSLDDWQSVATLEDFVAYLKLIDDDWRADAKRGQTRDASGAWVGDRQEWEHGTPGAWAEAMAAWIEARLDGDWESEADLTSASWRTFAYIMYAGKVYE